MTVESILTVKGRNVLTILPEHSVADACKIMAEKKIGALVVCDSKGRIVGIFSERDVVRGLNMYGPSVHSMPARNLMTENVFTCTPDDSIKSLLDTMNTRRIRHLPVVENDQLVGIVSIGDLVNRRLAQAQLEIGVLKDVAMARAG